MNWILKSLPLLLLIYSNATHGQCQWINATTTITGLYSSDLNPPDSSIIYVAPTATITGDINLVNSSLYNSGTILSKKITFKQRYFDNQYIFSNCNIINCDSILFDTLGHFHNYDTLICNYFRMRTSSNVDNFGFFEANRFLAENYCEFYSLGTVRANYFEMQNNGTHFYNASGTITVGKLFRVGTGSSLYGILNICVDSCFINNTWINSLSLNSTIKVNGISENTGQIFTLYFCDLSSTNGGMLDVNTGTITGVTYCTADKGICDFGLTSIKENKATDQKLLLYPNPTNNLLNLRSDDDTFENSEIEILNYLGQTVLKLPYSNIISVTNLASGYYSLKIETQSGRINSSFVKE